MRIGSTSNRGHRSERTENFQLQIRLGADRADERRVCLVSNACDQFQYYRRASRFPTPLSH